VGRMCSVLPAAATRVSPAGLTARQVTLWPSGPLHTGQQQ
jgi:hypothetical protein